MGDRSTIEWTEATWNPITGCDRCSPGCDHCYIERTIPFRREGRRFDENGRMGVRLHPERLDQPLRWRRPRRVFVNSLSDLFHPDVPTDFIVDVFARMAVTRRHTFQVLTKRHRRLATVLNAPGFPAAVAEEATEILVRTGPYQRRQIEIGDDWIPRPDGRGSNVWHPPWPLPNVWLGVSVENQRYADLRIPRLLGTPAAVRFLSCEPLLGPVDLGMPQDHRRHERDYVTTDVYPQCLDCSTDEHVVDWTQPSGPQIDWVIAGGESGPGHRPPDPDWIRSLRDQCLAAGVAFHFKQWGGHTSKAGGRDLDGRTWDEMPASTAGTSIELAAPTTRSASGHEHRREP